MFSFASIEFTSFTRRTLQFGIQLRMHGIAAEEAGMCLAWIKFQQNTGSNCFASWRHFQLFQEWIQRVGNWGDGLLRGQENVLMGGRKLRGIFWRLGGIGENRVLLPVVNL